MLNFCTNIYILGIQVNPDKGLKISNTYYLLTFDVKNYSNINDRQ